MRRLRGSSIGDHFPSHPYPGYAARTLCCTCAYIISSGYLCPQISCPVRLIHCAEDIAYPLRYARELKSQLRQAGIGDVVLCQVPGPHYSSVLNPQMCVIYPSTHPSLCSVMFSFTYKSLDLPRINPILRDVVFSASPRRTPGLSRNTPSQANGFNDRQRMTTPFTHKLAKYGYDPHDDESDSERE